MTPNSALLSNYLSLRAARLAVQKEADDLKGQEENVLAELKSQMTTTDAVVAGNMIASFKPVRKPEVVDWEALHGFIQTTGNFSLLHARLTESAVKEIWEAGDDVPGVVAHDFFELKIQKLK